MRNLLLFLLALPLFAVPPTVTVTSVGTEANGGLSHSDVLIFFDTSGSYDHMQVRYNSAASCSGGTGGSIQPGSNDSVLFTSGMSVDLAGLNAGTLYHVCIEVSNDSGSTWSTGSQVDITTLPLPYVHPAPPIPPASFDSTYPDTTGYTTLTVAADCSDLQSKFNTAMSGLSPTQGYVIRLPNSVTPCSANPDHIRAQNFANDIVFVPHTQITVGSPGTIDFSPSAQPFSEGQMVTYGKGAFDGPSPASTSCRFGNGLQQGQRYFVHVTGANTIQLYCMGQDGKASSTLMDFTSQGTTTNQFVPWTQTSGTCPSASGGYSCTYYKRNLKWIVIRSDASDAELPPPGVRLTPDYCAAGKCAILVNPVANVNPPTSIQYFVTGGQDDGSVQTMAGNIWIGPGIEVTNATDPSQGTFGQLLHTFEWDGGWVFDRLYLHGNPTPQRWGGLGIPSFELDGQNIILRDSYIDNMTNWSATPHEGSSAVLSRGPGPNIIYNARIEGVGVPIHFDSSGGTFSTRGDFSVIRSYFYASPTWMQGGPQSDGFYYGMRQPLEFKAGFRDLVEGNIFDRDWVEDTPSSVFIACTSTDGEGVTDFLVRNNIFKHGPGISNFCVNTNGGHPQTIPPNRVRFTNNLAYDINLSYWVPGGGFTAPNGWIWQGPLGGEDNVADHNTFVGTTGRIPTFIRLSNTAAEGTQILNNFFYFDTATQGLSQEGTVGPNNACNSLLGQNLQGCMLTNSLIAKNVFGSVDSTQAQINGWWPALTNHVPATPSSLTAIGWLSLAGNDYRLSSTSDYRSGGSAPTTDGKDMGVDMTALNNATGKVMFGGAIPQSGHTVRITFTAPDTQSCPVDWDTQPIPTAGRIPTRVADAGTAPGPRAVDVTPSAAGRYYYRIQCAVEQPTGQFLAH